MRNAVINSGVRTLVDKFSGILRSIPVVDLGALVPKVALKKVGRRSREDEVIMGNVVGAGRGQNVARQAMIRAGIAKEIGPLR